MKTESEIEKLRDQAVEACDEPKYHGMTYEEGVRAALEWVLDEYEDESPL